MSKLINAINGRMVCYMLGAAVGFVGIGLEIKSIIEEHKTAGKDE